MGVGRCVGLEEVCGGKCMRGGKRCGVGEKEGNLYDNIWILDMDYGKLIIATVIFTHTYMQTYTQCKY